MSWSEYRKTAHVRAMELPHPGVSEIPEGLEDVRRMGHINSGAGGLFWRVWTNEGPVWADPGDYLCQDPDSGCCWPVERETFERTYEEVRG